MAGKRLGDAQVRLRLVVFTPVCFLALRPVLGDIFHERALDRLKMDGPGDFRRGLQRGNRLLRMPKRNASPGARQLYRRLLRRAAARCAVLKCSSAA